MQSYYKLHPQVYDDQFWWKKDDLMFWEDELAQRLDNSILELGAGTGRIAKVLKDNCNYLGLELSSIYVEHANKKLQCNNSLVLDGDMRSFSLNKKFDFIFIGFNSLLHLLTDKDIADCFKSIYQHMHSKSLFYIDIFSPFVHQFKSTNKPQKIVEFIDSEKKCNSIIWETVKYNDTDDIVNVMWEYHNGNKVYRAFKFQMKILYPDTLTSLLIDAGFKINNIWGTYNKENFSENSDKQIYKCSIQ